MDYNVDNIESKGEINPTMDTDIVLHKDGKFQRSKIFGFNGKIKPAFVDSVVNEITNNYSVDPDQIVPSEATYQDDTLAGTIIKRIDKGTNLNVNYREITKNLDNVTMTDAMLDGVVYIKRGSKYYLNVEFEKTRTVYLDSYGLAGDNVLRPISTVFPSVTLAQVQALDSTATLANSADWYVLMLVNKILPINSTLILTGNYVIDKKITWRRSSITWKGGVFKKSGKGQVDKVPAIFQVTSGEDAIAFVDGDGLTNSIPTQILNVTFEDFNIIGTRTTATRSGDGISINIITGDMVFCYFKNIRLSNHGKCGFRHYMGHMNEVYFDEVMSYLNFDTDL